MFVKKGDKVKVITGKDKNKEGVVLAALPKKDKVIVEGVNIVKKHQVELLKWKRQFTYLT
jgi:large subunit ribosomal protein L24